MLDFDGVNDVVTASDANFPNGDLLSSMAFWVFLRNTSSSGGVVGFGNTGVTLAAFRTYANLRGAGIVSVEFAGNNTAYSTTSLIPLQWYHFAVVKKPGVINQTTDIYINGVKQTLVGTSSANTPNTHIKDSIYTAQSPNLEKILKHTLLWSDNFVAEYLARLACLS